MYFQINAIDLNNNHYLYPEKAAQCLLDHDAEYVSNKINIGLSKVLNPIGWRHKYSTDWFLGSDPTKDGLNENDVKTFSVNIPSNVVESTTRNNI